MTILSFSTQIKTLQRYIMKRFDNYIHSIKNNGISLRVTSIIMTIVIVIITAAMFVMTFLSSHTLSELSEATDNYIVMHENAEALMNASDYLTQEAQLFTITHDMENLDNYFREVNQNRRRENAVKTLSNIASDSEALHQLEQALDASVSLMDREYYTMLLVLEATGVSYRPQELAQLTLKPEHEALSADQKLALAQRMMHDREYYDQKLTIRSHMTECLNELVEDIHAEQRHAHQKTNALIINIRLLGITQLIIVLLGLIINKVLGINPILKSVQRIRDDDSIPVTGASEFRYLANAYNKMHAAIKENLSMLNYRASHDKLTGVYNRAGYEIISTSLDLKTTTMLLVDVDNFKEVNDTYGHIAGDKTLVNLAKTLAGTFRSKDFVCRLGGDEFVVFLLDTCENCETVITEKIAKINESLSAGTDDLPPITISVGCVCGEEGANAQLMLKHADLALYEAKENGKKECRFYKKAQYN